MNDIIKVFYAIILVTLAGCWNSAKILEFTNEDIDDFRKNLTITDSSIQKSVINDVFVYPSMSYLDGDTYKGIYELRIAAISYKKDKIIQVKKVTIEQLNSKFEPNSSVVIDRFLDKYKFYYGGITITKDIDAMRAYELSKGGIPLSVTVTAECEGKLITFTYDFKVKIKRFAVPKV